MSGVLKDIWRHPLKSHGRENLQSVKLSCGAIVTLGSTLGCST